MTVDPPAESPSELFLAGYAPLAARGYALPCFATAPRPNTWYTARAAIDGDHLSHISTFEEFLGEGVQELPLSEFHLRRLGDPWCDVFLWQDNVYIGTPAELWSQLEAQTAALREGVPLSFMDLVLDVPGGPRATVAEAAMAFLTRRYGATRAREWRRDAFRSAARVRLRRHAARAASPPAVRSVELSGGDDRLSILAPASVWEGIPDRQTVLRELDRLAQDLGLSVQTLVSVDDDGIVLGDLPTVKPEPPRPEVLVMSLGRRAEELARLIQRPEWLPVWPDRPIERQRFDLGLRLFEGADPPFDVETYVVAVLVADDGADLRDLPIPLSVVLNDLAARGVPLLLAPALPRLGPSRRLTQGISASEASFPVAGLIDTSMARSPFWKGDQRRAVDRTVADIIVGAASLVAAEGPVRDGLPARGPTPLITYAFSHLYPADRNTPRSEASYETGRDSDQVRVRFSVNSLRRNGLGGRTSGMVDLRKPGADFKRFAAEVIEELTPEDIGFVARPATSDVPAFASDSDGWATFQVEGPEGVVRRLAVAAAAPTLETLTKARDAGWPVARYTDRQTLEDVLIDAPFREIDLPAEIDLPRLRRLPGNRRLASRGIDPRDAILIPGDVCETWMSAAVQSPLRDMVRPYRRSIEPWEAADACSQYALPNHAFRQAMSDDDGAAHRLSQMLRMRTRLQEPLAEKRGGDLRAAWSEPPRLARRYIVSDGDLPVKVAGLPPDHVPGQALFLIDGDTAVPALLSSRAFQIWAHATMSRSRGWMSRFSVSWTFEAFPMPDGLELQQRADGPPMLLYGRGTPVGDQIARMSKQFDALLGGAVYQPPRAEDAGMRQLDAHILESYGLGPDADDLEVLKRLVSLNRQA